MAAIVNYRDLLLQGSATRYIAPSVSPDYVSPDDLGDLAYLDKVSTPQIQPGSITASSGIVANGAILTQQLAANAATIAVGEYTASSIASTSLTFGVPYTVQTLSAFTSKGGKVLILGGLVVEDPGTALPTGVVIRLRRNGSDIASFSIGGIAGGMFTLPPVGDQPGSGVSCTYTMTFEFAASSGTFYIKNRGLYAIECIR